MKENKGVKALTHLGRIFIAIVLAAMVFMVFWNAVARYFFNNNYPVFEELSRYLFVWVSFLGAMMAYLQGKHVGIDIVTSRLKGKAKIIVKLIARAIVFLCLIIMGIGGWQYFMLTATDPSPSAKIPFGIISGLAVILVVFMLVVNASNTLLDIAHHRQSSQQDEEGGEE